MNRKAKTMQALTFKRYGGPEQIKTLKTELQKIARDLPPVG